MYIFHSNYMHIFLFMAEIISTSMSIAWYEINGNWKPSKEALVLSMVTIK